MTDIKKDIAKNTRWYRKLHRYVGSWLLLIFFSITITGLLLGWKKHSGGIILPDTQKGSSTNLSEWLSVDSLQTLAQQAIHQKLPGYSTTVDRMDVRPDKGTIKVSFKDHFYEVQVDGATGEILAVNLRKSDIIEQLHDGSIIDTLFNIGNGAVKLGYTTAAGLGLLFLCISGFWLWYNPKRIRKLK